jgi:hypothetical protein
LFSCDIFFAAASLSAENKSTHMCQTSEANEDKGGQSFLKFSEFYFFETLQLLNHRLMRAYLHRWHHNKHPMLRLIVRWTVC